MVVKCPLWIPSGEVGKTFQRKPVDGATFLFPYIYIQIFPKGTTDATPCRHAAVDDSSELNINLCCEQVPPPVDMYSHVALKRKSTHGWVAERTEVGKRPSLDTTHHIVFPKHTRYIRVRWCPSEQGGVEVWASLNPCATQGLGV